MNDFIEIILRYIQSGKTEIANFLLENYLDKLPNDVDVRLLKLLFNLETYEPSDNKIKLLNLGCGYTYHPDWINIDFIKTGELVIQYNLLNGIPFADNSFDVVYHSHVLEHFPKRFAPKFLKECFRVLKPGGTIRVAVPNLEEIVKIYLENLQLALQGDEIAKIRYEWILLELLDQMVRNIPGGEMFQFWRQMPLPCEEFIYQRVGIEAKKAIEEIRRQGKTISPEEYKMLNFEPELNPLKIGEFRLSGEIHQWMYDRFSLKELLQEAGFIDIEKVDAFTSRIPDFSNYHLDVTPEGQVRKPDSLFMEAVKPENKLFFDNSTNTSELERSNFEKEEHNLKVSHLSVWDTGGAGTAAIRLHLALTRLGIDSNFLTIFKNTNLDNVYLVERKQYAEGWNWSTYYSNWHNKLLTEYPNRPLDLEIFTSIKGITELKKNRLIKDSQIVNFHWISSFVDFEDDIDTFENKKIVWTLHDENAFTGGCHYTSGCTKYRIECGACPQLNSTNKFDLSNRQFWTKKNFINKCDITIVTPSKWLLEKVKKSFILEKKSALHILNGIPVGLFHRYDKTNVRKLLNLPLESFLILFGAEYQTKRKGTHLISEFLRKCPPEVNGKKIELVVFGELNLTDISVKIPVRRVGYVKNQQILAMLFSACDVFLMLSLEDNLPNTAIESVCCGTPVVAFNIGGLSDIIEHKKNGWLANPFFLDEILEGVAYLSKISEQDREKIAIDAQLKFNDIQQAINYLQLYQSLISNFKIPFQIDNTLNEINFDSGFYNNLFILPLKSILYNFSGLDNDFLMKQINFNKITIKEFIDLFVIRFLLNLKFGFTNILFVSTSPNLYLPKLPSIFKYQLVLINLDKIDYFKETNFEKNPVFELSSDKLENTINSLNPNLMFFVTDLDSLLQCKSDISNFFNGLKILNSSKKLILFVKFKLSELDTLKTFLKNLKIFNSEQIDRNINIYSNNEECLVLEKIGNEKYSLITTILDFNAILREKLKSINSIKNYNTDYPKVSIITPNFNQAKFLEKCIESIIHQDYPNLEYIFIDRGSTDNSLSILKKYQKYVNHLLTEKEIGKYDAINIGCDLATGDIISVLNADDFYLPGTLHFVAEFFTTYLNAEWITSSNITTLSLDGKIQTFWGFKKYSLKQILEMNFEKYYIQLASTFWRRSLWKKSGGKLQTKDGLTSDLELWIRLFNLSNLFVLDCPLAISISNPDSRELWNTSKYLIEAKSIKENKEKLSKLISETKDSIYIPIFEFIEKTNLKFVGKILDKIIIQYQNFEYPFASLSDKKNIEDWLFLLKRINLVLNKSLNYE